MACHDIDGSTKGRTSIHTAGRAFQYLNTLNIADTHWEVGCKMSGMWVGDVHTVEQESHLVKGAAIDADVRLNTKATTLTDVHACD